MLKTYPAVTADPGVTRQVLSDSPELMVVSFRFDKGAKGALHAHPHVQSSYCRSGRFSFSLAGEEIDVRPGDCFVIPSGARHGCTCVESGELIDSFAPRRDDFL